MPYKSNVKAWENTLTAGVFNTCSATAFSSYLCLSEHIWSQLLPVFNYLLGLLHWNIDLQSRGDTGVDEAVDDGRDLLLDDGLITM